MELESVTLKLPRNLLSGAQRVATARDVTIGHMVRQLLKREVDCQLNSERTEGTDTRLLAAVQALLACDFGVAKSWPDLISRLACEGMELRSAGADLGVHMATTGRHLCNAGDIDEDYATLVQRFGGPAPCQFPPVVEAVQGVDAMPKPAALD
ncbi:hypothetical protein OAI26_02510 [Sulfitobacter sp.]|nr:hypothetical protein [Sulfitobacter sp.]